MKIFLNTVSLPCSEITRASLSLLMTTPGTKARDGRPLLTRFTPWKPTGSSRSLIKALVLKIRFGIPRGLYNYQGNLHQDSSAPADCKFIFWSRASTAAEWLPCNSRGDRSSGRFRAHRIIARYLSIADVQRRSSRALRPFETGSYFQSELIYSFSMSEAFNGRHAGEKWKLQAFLMRHTSWHIVLNLLH